MKSNIPEPRFLTVPDAAKLCGVSRNTVYMWVINGKLKAYQTPGRTNLIRPGDLKGFMSDSGMFVPGTLSDMARQDDKLQQERDRLKQESLHGKGKFSILVVDDDPMLLTVANQALKDEYNVFLAETGFEALHILTQHAEIELILLDLRMPGQHGTDTMTEIRRLNSHARIVIVTGFSEELPPASSSNGLYSRVLPKPVEVATLRAAVTEELALL